MADPSIEPGNNLHIFGIRHHGPGSARSLVRALEELQPDCILIEGPPDAEAVLDLAADPAMQPPVALLIYRPDNPQQAAYYPFATFSPEWQAIRYSQSKGVPARFMDLPQSIRLALEASEEPEVAAQETSEVEAMIVAVGEDEAQALAPEPAVSVRQDPLGWIAKAAGFSDGERWWEYMVEHRRDGTDLYAGILEMMAALREAEEEGEPSRAGLPVPPGRASDDIREAYMRKTIRAAQAEGFQRIAVVCGAWHAPVLTLGPESEKQDAALLKGLPTVKVQATWIPWTHGRLSYYTGYGAGIESPGWYQHLWSNAHASTSDITILWMSRVAAFLREQDLDASTAHVIEAVRLAEGLATLRELPLPGLTEMNEAVLSVLLNGDSLPMRLIYKQLIVGETLGAIPEATPSVPLQIDLQREQRRLRLPAEASARTLDLDLRNANDLARSHLLHRLTILGVPWGRLQRTGGGAKGTFHEIWNIEWAPELAVTLILAGVWGNTIVDAATAIMKHKAAEADSLPTLTTLADHALLADLPDAVAPIMQRLESEAALSTDTNHLMDALPPLANIVRYGNVRGTDASTVTHVVDGLVTRICIGLPGAFSSLDDEAAEAMHERILATHGAITLLSNTDYTTQWNRTLAILADQAGLHGLIAGRATRILLDAGVIDSEEAARRLGLALSRAIDPPAAAAWTEGFLKGSGTALLHDDTLWDVLDSWITELSPDAFTALLPLLRRTFSSFTVPERRQMGQRAKRGPGSTTKRTPSSATEAGRNFDHARANSILPLLSRILGLNPEEAANG